MNSSPADLLNPIFNFLDALIQNDGVYLSLAVIGWVLSGGLRRKSQDRNSATVIPGIIFTMHTPPPSPTPIVGIEVDQIWNDGDEIED